MVNFQPIMQTRRRMLGNRSCILHLLKEFKKFVKMPCRNGVTKCSNTKMCILIELCYDQKSLNNLSIGLNSNRSFIIRQNQRLFRSEFLPHSILKYFCSHLLHSTISSLVNHEQGCQFPGNFHSSGIRGIGDCIFSFLGDSGIQNLFLGVLGGFSGN